MTIDPADDKNPCTSLYELAYFASRRGTAIAHAMLCAVGRAKWVSYYGWMK